MNEIVAFITAMSHLTNAAKAMFQAHDQTAQDSVRVKLNDALLDLQAKVSGIQVSYEQLLEKNEQLKRQIAEYDKWDEEKTRYVLHKMVRGLSSTG
jgi:uncharacterized protein YlxW (UPF0749 family)